MHFGAIVVRCSSVGYVQKIGETLYVLYLISFFGISLH